MPILHEHFEHVDSIVEESAVDGPSAEKGYGQQDGGDCGSHGPPPVSGAGQKREGEQYDGKKMPCDIRGVRRPTVIGG